MRSSVCVTCGSEGGREKGMWNVTRNAVVSWCNVFRGRKYRKNRSRRGRFLFFRHGGDMVEVVGMV